MARKFHPIGIRFQRLTAHIVPPQGGGAWSTDRKRVKMYFVVADERHKSMCRYYWEEGDIGKPADSQYQVQVFDANADESPPAGFRNEVFGVEGAGFVALDLDPFWTFRRLGASADQGQCRHRDGEQRCVHRACSRRRHQGGGTVTDVQAAVPRQSPSGSRSRGHERLGPKQTFGLSNKWLPRF